LTQELRKLAQAAFSFDLKHAFRWHLAETENHVARLDRIFAMLQQDPAGKTCEGIKGLLSECDAAVNGDAGDGIGDESLLLLHTKR
jgi:ferritin-like metal-binding protein YciE